MHYGRGLLYWFLMISYPEARFVKKFVDEALPKTRGLPPYEKGKPAVDYTEAKHAFALNATLLHDRRRAPEEVLARGPSKDADILLVKRARGHGVIGSFSGVSGYIGTLENPGGNNKRAHFDPIEYTLREEFETECGFTRREFDLVRFYAGRPTVEDRTITPGAKITVVPILGLCVERPEVRVDNDELASYRWVGLGALKAMEWLARHYDTVTLPSALGAIGLKADAIARLLE